MKLFSEQAKKIFREKDDKELTIFLGRDLNKIWEEEDEDEQRYEERLLKLIDEKLNRMKGGVI